MVDILSGLLFQSTPPARGATAFMPCQCQRPWISIHAPREGGDVTAILNSGIPVISIHAPREGGDLVGHRAFQDPPDFNPRPPRGGRLLALWVVAGLDVISIHAPREGGDKFTRYQLGLAVISIHAPREGGDHSSDFSSM